MDDEPINPNIRCHVCGENEFELREGFYYCVECGIKQEQVRVVEVENADAFNETTGMRRQTKTIKLKTIKAEKREFESKFLLLFLYVLVSTYSTTYIVGVLQLYIARLCGGTVGHGRQRRAETNGLASVGRLFKTHGGGIL